MNYNIQQKLNDILEILQSRVNEGKYDPLKKEEAVKIITKIRTEYQAEIDDYIKKRTSIDRQFIDERFITDRSYMLEYVKTKKDIEELRGNLLYLHKHIIIDNNVRWEEQYLELVDLFFKRPDNQFPKAKFFQDLIRWRFKNDDHNSKYNIDINYTIRETDFYDKLKCKIIENPSFLSELLSYDPVSEFDLERKFNEIFEVDNSFILDLVIAKYDVLKYLPEKFKEHFLVNLFAINENLKAKQYLHSNYKNNNSFCSLLE
jgi:hypothetical protein